MLKSIRARILAMGAGGIMLLAIIVAGTASAGSFLANAHFATRYIPQTPSGLPPNCTGNDCAYVSNVDDQPYFKNASGTVVPIGAAPSASVSASGYTNANVTVDAFGRITAITNGLAPAGGGYTTVQSNGSNLAQRSPLNFFGSPISCKDNSGAGRTDCTGGVFNVNDYGAVCDGSTDSTTAFQSAASAAPAGSQIFIPPCTPGYVTTDTMTITHDNVHVVGAGPQATKWIFNPASAKAAFKVDNGGGVDRTYGGSITGIYFKSGNTTQQKIAIDLVDTSGYTVRNIWVDPSSSANPPWRGSGSIGIRARGREMTVIDNVRIWTDTPILVDVDPYSSLIVSCDHFSLSNSYLLSTPGGGNSNLKINDNIIVTNFQVFGDNAWIVDKYGLYWSDTLGTSVSANVRLENIRTEQAQDSTGYSFYIDRTGSVLQNLQMQNVYPATAQNGIHLNGIQHATISRSVFGAIGGALKLLDIGSGILTDLYLENNFVNNGSTVNLGTLVLEWGTPQRITAAPMQSTAYYVDSATAASRGITLSTAMTLQTNVLKNSSTANTNPLTFDTVNTYTSSNRLVSVKNASVEKFFVDSGGSVVSTSGIFDTASGTQLAVGNNNASSVALGRAGGSGVFVSAPTLACATAGSCTAGAGGQFFGRINSRHFSGDGTTPSAGAAGTGCNTSSAVSNTGTDSSGTINVTCGGTGATSATIFSASFAATWSSTPRCGLWAANAATAALPIAQTPFASGSNTTTLTVTSNTTGLAAGTYSWFYKCEQ